MTAVVEQVPALREQFDEALATGGTVSVPELAAYMPDQLAQSRVPHLCTSPDGVTVAEGVALDRKELRTEIGGIVGQEAVTQPADQVAQGELDEPAVLSVVRLLGTAFGIPTVQAIRSYRAWLSEGATTRARARGLLGGVNGNPAAPTELPGRRPPARPMRRRHPA